MNKVFLIGNLTRDPEQRTTQSGVSVCSFTIAVNRRRSNNAEAGQPEADFFRITAWRQLGDICAKYLAKGRKVAVVGTVSASAYTANDGTARASLEVQADDVEFLTPRGEAGEAPAYNAPAAAAPRQQNANVGSAPQGGGFVQVEDEDLPF
ncbi:MAG: single-stranded DNA-binding protein [Clostridia bacterium]|jgi:single-strand DNA-binding protein|nr:single-stranded DNA-binding protein [Clostridia bacterium]MCR4886805.1 single-stranded DNA-binding protein [Clostridiales bacterium]